MPPRFTITGDDYGERGALVSLSVVVNRGSPIFPSFCLLPKKQRQDTSAFRVRACLPYAFKHWVLPRQPRSCPDVR